MYRLKKYFYWLITWPAIVFFLLLKGENKRKLKQDLSRFYSRRMGVDAQSGLKAFYAMMVARQEFRSVFYMRIGRISLLIKWLLPGMPTLNFGSTSKQIAGGLFIEHGWAMVIDAERVGKNLWINQCVTVGYGRGGASCDR